ncbi:MAG: RsmF rRNA methyltransferase first C-terminal domain-containing protein [Lachnospiraceae bacterium]|nr:RsmF rRNA methyltransferase first C-terminal domain-containing protein [Lachnospiraceae bacterium]
MPNYTTVSLHDAPELLPEDFIKRSGEDLGEEADDFLNSLTKEPVASLRVNPLKVPEGTDAVQRFRDAAEFTTLEEVSWERNGFYYASPDQPGKHPMHEAGVYYIQEASAMLPVTLLEPLPGERILDLCAAPGGKTTQIAGYMAGKGLLVTNEVNGERARILSENVERMGIPNALVLNETVQRLSAAFPACFDRILVDAPCSGEGMFRKNADACRQWSLSATEDCAARQKEILDHAAIMLRPGGRLVYSTCTFAPVEDEEQMTSFVREHPEFTLVSMHRIWPHKDRGEGHFSAVLIKEGDAKASSLKGEDLTSVTDKNLESLRLFWEETLKKNLPSRVLLFGDQVYQTPDEMPRLRGLKVLRAGLHLGTLKKNRFEPSHALALSLKPEDAVHVADLSHNEKDLTAYLNGMTLHHEGDKGWYLVVDHGYTYGWGKLSGQVLKNHYPIGLRRYWMTD